jgi:hypothetical protein
MKKSELRQIIREEISKLNESAPSEYDVVKFYVSMRGVKYPYYLMYIDSTHTAISTKEPKGKSTAGMGVYHISQLKDEVYYAAMVDWMRSGNATHINNKVFVQER